MSNTSLNKKVSHITQSLNNIMQEIKLAGTNLPFPYSNLFPSIRINLHPNAHNQFTCFSQQLDTEFDHGFQTARDSTIKKFLTSPRTMIKPRGDSNDPLILDLNEPYCAPERNSLVNETTLRFRKRENTRMVYASKPLSWNKKDNKVITLFKQCYVLERLRGYLSFKDYFSLMISSKRIYSRVSITKKIEQVIIQGVSNKQRLHYWIHQCEIEKLKRNAILSYADYKRANNKVIYEMKKDLQRISSLENPFHFSKQTIEELENVLKAFAVKNMNIQYTQGLNFIAGILLLVFNDEEVNIKLII